MIEIEGDLQGEAFKEANETLIEAFIDLWDGGFNYVDDCDIVSELVHTIRTYDNMRRRSLINNKDHLTDPEIYTGW